MIRATELDFKAISYFSSLFSNTFKMRKLNKTIATVHIRYGNYTCGKENKNNLIRSSNGIKPITYKL